MKKKIYKIIPAIFISVFFIFSGVAHAANSPIDGAALDGNVVLNTTSTGVQAVIKGVLTVGGRADITTFLPGRDLYVRYQKIPDNTAPSFIANTIWPDSFTDRKCSVDDVKVDNGFTCMTDASLVPGLYAYQIGARRGTSTWTSFTLATGFTVSSSTVTAQGPTVSFGFVSAITPHQMNATTTGGGYDFTVNMNVSGVTATTTMNIELGFATQQGTGANYTCSDAGKSSATATTTPGGSTSVAFQFTKVTDANYCVSVKQNVGSGLIVIPATVGTDVDGAGFFDTKGSIIHVGNAAPLDPNATNNPYANPTGCVTNSDNSNYCMLAPLPGLGDGSGNLPITDFGKYMSTIIYIVFGLIGILSVFMIVFGGIEYMTGTSAGEKEGGKSRITNAIFGLLLALVSYIILNTLNPRLVTLGVNIPQVQVDGTGLTQNAGDDGLDTTTVTGKTKVRNGAGAELTACDNSNLVTVSTSELDQGMNIFNTSSTIKVNKDVKADLVAAFTDYKAAVAGKQSLASYKINSLYGYTCKGATGDKTVYSAHAFGLAIDINASTNPFTKGSVVTDLPDELVQALKSHGFGWGGNWNSSKDAMHFSKLTNENGKGADSYSYE